MSRIIRSGLGTAIISGMLGMTVLGQKEGPKANENNLSTEKGTDVNGSAIAIVRQASELVRYARDNESPVAMLTAVQMLRQVRLQDAGARVAEGTAGDVPGGNGTAQQKGATPPPTLDPKTLLAEARAWAKGNQSLLALIDTEAARGHQGGGTLGSPDGAVRQLGRLPARTYKDWAITMRGGELARISVIGDGDTDLDVEVYDENGHLIASDTDGTDTCYVEWYPKWRGQFRIRIKNLGYVYNDYILLSN